MDPTVALRIHMKPTADGNELCGILRKALSDCGIWISRLSKENHDFTIHFETPKLEYSACVSLLRRNYNKQSIHLGEVIVTLVSVCGLMWSSFI